ncbi:MAG: hypothetical protein IJB27_00500 [Clostridia bacterium]|nr:hypothetical protein [Clostridia bacterium]
MQGVRLWTATVLMVTAATVAALLVGTMGETKKAPTAYRTIGVFEGQVAVFRPDGDTPERVLDTCVLTLPPEEQALLRAGIAVADANELAVRLEDYTS